jgi:dynein heavy chain
MDDYNLESAQKVCGDVAGLAAWTEAMAFFYTINKEVLPLKANLAIQEAKLGAAMSDLNRAQAQLDEKEKELAEVLAIFDAAMKEKQVRYISLVHKHHLMKIVTIIIIKLQYNHGPS